MNGPVKGAKPASRLAPHRRVGLRRDLIETPLASPRKRNKCNPKTVELHRSLGPRNQRRFGTPNDHIEPAASLRDRPSHAAASSRLPINIFPSHHHHRLKEKLSTNRRSSTPPATRFHPVVAKEWDVTQSAATQWDHVAPTVDAACAANCPVGVPGDRP